MIGFVFSPIYVIYMSLNKFGAVSIEVELRDYIINMVGIIAVVIIDLICILLIVKNKKVGYYILFILSIIDYAFIIYDFIKVNITPDNSFIYFLQSIGLFGFKATEVSLILLFSALSFQSIKKRDVNDMDNLSNIIVQKS